MCAQTPLNPSASNSLAPVLYAEDEGDDVLLLEYAFKMAFIPNPLKVVRDGDEAVAYLSGDGPYADRGQHPLPGLVLLDLKMPRRSGLQVLRWIRHEPHLAGLPVVIYTSSEHPDDLQQAEALGANEYLIKPSLLGQMAEVMRRLTQRWLAKPGLGSPPPNSTTASLGPNHVIG